MPTVTRPRWKLADLKPAPKTCAKADAIVSLIDRFIKDECTEKITEPKASADHSLAEAEALFRRVQRPKGKRGVARELLDAVRKCYVAALALLPDNGTLVSQGVAALSEYLEQLPSVSIPFTESDDKFDFKVLDGYKQSTPEADHYVIKRESFRKIFTSTEQEILVTRWLAEKEWITVATPKQSGGVSERKPKNQIIWPDGKRRRSIEIVWPRKSKDMQKVSLKKAS